MCQLQNVTLHADKDTDEIYAQMSRQPVNTEKDIFPVPDFGFKPNKHPSFLAYHLFYSSFYGFPHRLDIHNPNYRDQWLHLLLQKRNKRLMLILHTL
ncbi:hypothetical protein ACB092_07G194600 [Castanea dentata]